MNQKEEAKQHAMKTQAGKFRGRHLVGWTVLSQTSDGREPSRVQRPGVIYLRITGRAGEGQPAAGSVWVERGLPGAAAG